MANEMIRGIEQIAAAKESTVGTAETLAGSDVEVRVVTDSTSVTLQPTLIERNLHRDTFSMYPDIAAGDATNKVTLATFNIAFELTGDSAGVGTVPGWSKFMQACGLRQFTGCSELAISGGITGGPFQDGETVEGGSSGETAVVIGDHFTGETFIRTRTASGSFTNGETITGDVSGATATLAGSSAQTDSAGTSWSSVSDVDSNAIEALTIGAYMDTYRIIARGCRGSLSFPFTWGDRLIVLGTYQGILSTQDSSAGLFSSGDVSYTQAVPPTFRGANMVIQGGSDSEWDSDDDLRLNQISLDLGNNVVVRQNVNDADGYDPALIVGRAPTGSFNPDMVATTEQKLLEQWYAGDTAHMRWDLGSTAGNRFQFKVAAAQYSGITFGDRDNVITAEANFKLTGGLHSGSSQDTVGADNEFCFHYR